MLEFILSFDLDHYENHANAMMERVFALKVPRENNINTLAQFNYQLDDLHTEVTFSYNRLRSLKDASSRFLKNVLDDHYAGSSSTARKAAGIQLAQRYPTTGVTTRESLPEQIDLFLLNARINYVHDMYQACIDSISNKSNAKITNNSLLKLEKDTTH